MPNLEKIEGNIATTPTGAQVDLTTGQLISAPPATSITPASLAPATPTDVTPTPTVPTPNIANIPTSTSPPTTSSPTPSSSEVPTNPFIKQIEDLTNQFQGKKSEETVAQGTAAAPFQEQLKSINEQIKMHQLNAMQNQEKALNAGETIGFAAGEAQRVQRNDAFEAFRLSALAEAAQGNITFAQNQAKLAIETKFAQTEKDLQTARQNILNNYDSFSAADKKRADAALLRLDKEDAFVAQQKSDLQGVQDETLKYSTVATPEQLNEMSKQTSKLGVAAVARKYNLVTPEQQKIQAETLHLKAQAAKELTQGKAVDPNTLQGMLNVYKSTGQLPTFGFGNSPLRAQFYAALGGASGQNIVNDAQTNKVVRSGLQTALKTQQNQYSAAQTSIGTLDKQLDLAKQYSDKVSRSDSPFINKYLLAIKGQGIGDTDTVAFNNIVKTASYEFAKILSGAAASIAGTTVSSAQDAEDLLNTALSKGQFNAVFDLMKQEAQFRLQSQKTTIDQIQKDLGNVGKVTQEAQNSQKISDEQIKKDYEEFLKTLPPAQSIPSPNTLVPTAPKSKFSGIGQGIDFDNIFSLFQ